jgi:hypothetical protein
VVEVPLAIVAMPPMASCVPPVTSQLMTKLLEQDPESDEDQRDRFEAEERGQPPPAPQAPGDGGQHRDPSRGRAVGREEPDLASGGSGLDAGTSQHEHRLREREQRDLAIRVPILDRLRDRRAEPTAVIEDEGSTGQQLLPPLML